MKKDTKQKKSSLEKSYEKKKKKVANQRKAVEENMVPAPPEFDAEPMADQSITTKPSKKVTIKEINIIGVFIVMILILVVYFISQGNKQQLNESIEDTQVEEPVVQELTPEQILQNQIDEIHNTINNASQLQQDIIINSNALVVEFGEDESEEATEAMTLIDEALLEIEGLDEMLVAVYVALDNDNIEEAQGLAISAYSLSQEVYNKIIEAENLVRTEDDDASDEFMDDGDDSSLLEDDLIEGDAVAHSLEEEEEEIEEEDDVEEDDVEEDDVEEEEEETVSSNESISTNSNNTSSNNASSTDTTTTNSNSSNSNSSNSNSSASTHVCNYVASTVVVKSAWSDIISITESVSGAYFKSTGEWIAAIDGQSTVESYATYLESVGKDSQYTLESRTIVTGSDVINYPAETSQVYKCSTCGKTK